MVRISRLRRVHRLTTDFCFQATRMDGSLVFTKGIIRQRNGPLQRIEARNEQGLCNVEIPGADDDDAPQ